MSADFALRTRVLLTVALLPCAALVLSVPLSAQHASQRMSAPVKDSQGVESTGLVIRENVRRVILDVVVTDANGKPVRGLKREDFSIAEDGKPQRALSFDIHDLDALPDSLPKLPPLPLNNFVNVPREPERGPLYVILLDLLNMSPDDQPFAREQLLKFIRGKPPGVRYAIFVLSDGLRMVQGFTDDQLQLYAAVDPKTPKAHVPRMFIYGDGNGVGNVYVIASVFTAIAHFVNGLPGRKNLVWLTGSLATTSFSTSDPGAEAANYDDEVKKAIDAMARSQVSVYPVDVRGVVVTHVMARPGGGQMVTTTDSPALGASYATEDEVAIKTGGEAFYSSNDVKEALIQATETGANYYTLTYSPTNKNYDGGVRKISVELAQHGYHLAYRRAYYADTVSSPPQHDSRPRHGKNHGSNPVAAASTLADSLYANMQHGAPLAHQLFFRAHLRPLGVPANATAAQMSNLEEQSDYFRVRRKDRSAKSALSIQIQPYIIDYTFSARSPRPDLPFGRLRPPRVEVAAAAFDEEGRLLNGAIENSGQSEAIGSADNPLGIYRVEQMFDVPVGATSIRIAVRDMSNDHVGAMELALPLAFETPTQTDSATASDQPSSQSVAPPNPN